VSFLRRLFAFLFSKGNKTNNVEPEKELPSACFSAAPTSIQDGKPKVGKTNMSNPDTRIDKAKELQGGSSSSKSGDDNTIAPEPACSTGEQVSPPSSSTGLGTTHVQSVPKKDSSEETGSTLIDCNNSENTDKVIDSNISNIILTETPKAVSPAITSQPPLEPIKQPKVTSHNTMKICPKTGEHMKEIEVLGEKIDVSSAGCYFDRGELARILGSKPSFLQSVGNFLTGRGNPYEAADRGADVMMLQQDIQKSEARLRTLRLGSPEYDVEYTNLKSLNAKMQGLNR